MLKYILVVLTFMMFACTLGQRDAKQNKSVPPAPTNPAAPTGTKETSVPTATVASPTTSPGDLRGIYVDSNAFPISTTDETALTASLGVSGVDGLVLVLGWDGIEHAKGQYDWTTLDQWMRTAVSSGKKVELSIRADYHTPSWLFQPAPDGGGATLLKFSFTRKPTDTTCLSETLAAPWDPTFLMQWNSMLAAVSAHLKSTGTYKTITLLRLTGINKDSDELHLPAESAKVACATDALAVWQQAGYRPSLLLKGWDAITDDFKQSFPDKTFSVAIIASAAPFPAIAEDGSLIKGKVTDHSLPLVTLAAQKFPGHLVIQNNSLYPNEPAQNETIQDAQNLHTLLAFQTNEDIRGQGASCGTSSPGGDRTTPCTDSTFLNELETGIYPLGKSNPLRAKYLEVFALNVNAFPAVILQAHNELLAQP